MTTIVNGWEYLTNIVPGQVNSQTLQNEYLKEYSLAYHKFLHSMCLSLEDIESIKNVDKERKLYIDCNDDLIDNNSSYYIKFKKSLFLKNKVRKIKTDLYKHYNPNGILVCGPYELQMNIYCVDLYIPKEDLYIPKEAEKKEVN